MHDDDGPRNPQRHVRDNVTLSIGDLSQRTGLSTATLRMWEQRHGFPVPRRLASGHRRYSEHDVTVIRSALRRRATGLRLDQAIDQARRDSSRGVPSIYATLRRLHPGLSVHTLTKRTLVAMSQAIEDQFCASADRAVLYGAFQREEHYLRSRTRWQELARTSAGATIFADFTTPDPDASPTEVTLPAEAEMRREWSVVCDAVDLPVVLAAWELPGQDVPDHRRAFESIWSTDGSVVHDAARAGAALLDRYGHAAERETDRARPEPLAVPGYQPDQAQVTALFDRMIAYVDHRNNR